MKKMIVISLALLFFLNVFSHGEIREPLAMPVFEIILEVALIPHIEPTPLSRIVNPPTMYELTVGYRAYWDTPSTGHLETNCYYELFQDNARIAAFNWDRTAATNLYPYNKLAIMQNAGDCPGGHIYRGQATARAYFPGNHHPFLEKGLYKELNLPNLNN